MYDDSWRGRADLINELETFCKHSRKSFVNELFLFNMSLCILWYFYPLVPTILYRNIFNVHYFNHRLVGIFVFLIELVEDELGAMKALLYFVLAIPCWLEAPTTVCAILSIVTCVSYLIATFQEQNEFIRF